MQCDSRAQLVTYAVNIHAVNIHAVNIHAVNIHAVNIPVQQTT